MYGVHLYLLNHMLLMAQRTNLRSSPLQMSSPMICPKDGGLTINRLAEPLDCGADTTASPVAVEVYKKNLKVWTTPATAVYKEEWSCTATCYFFGAQEHREIPAARVKLSEIEAREIDHNFCTGVSGKKQMQGNKHTDPHDCTCSWTGTWKHRANSCQKKIGEVQVTHGGLMFSGLGPVAHCKYDDGKCELPDKQWVFWQPNPRVQENYLLAYNGTGQLLRKGVILVPGLQEAFRLTSCNEKATVRSVVSCNTSTGFALSYRELNPIRKKRSTWSAEDDATWARFRAYHESEGDGMPHVPLELVTLNTTKPLGAVGPTGKPLDETVAKALEAVRGELLLKLSYLTEAVTKPVMQIGPLCQMIRNHEEQLRNLAIANPTLYVRALYETPYLIGTSAGDYIGVWPCKPVLDYDFVEQTGNCTKDPPIKYRLEQEEPWRMGYLDTATNIISDSSPRIKCKALPTTLTIRKQRLYLYKEGVMKEVPKAGITEFAQIKPRSSDSFLIDWGNNWLYNTSDFYLPNYEADVYDYISEQIDKSSSKYTGDTARADEGDRSTSVGLPKFNLPWPFVTLGLFGSLLKYAMYIAVGWLLLDRFRQGRRGSSSSNQTTKIEFGTLRETPSPPPPTEDELDELARLHKERKQARQTRETSVERGLKRLNNLFGKRKAEREDPEESIPMKVRI
ncbi:G [San Jacinto virus]|uniref:G n=1 Tax=San Jacinto virus TaxID=2596788 RepID=A0A516EL22_9MONO|nr:G [San Jacinto virus] [San Jacinto virus]QDO67015.1 G [San Jacinto virus] [San Jacinto virus]QFQ60718.1 glycoprotein [San Jacinto virus]